MNKNELEKFAEKILENWINYYHDFIGDEKYQENYNKIIENATKKEINQG